MTRTKRDMQDALPRYYDDSKDVDAILTANAKEFDRARNMSREITDQFYVRTAGDVGLGAWERVLDLPPRPNSSKRFRRNRILARLNGTAPATSEFITDVINAHVRDRSAKVIEYNSEYRFAAEIPVENPLYLDDINHDVNEIKPAHLAFTILGVRYAGALELDCDMYSFDVPYRPTNTFHTDIMSGKSSVVPFEFISGGYEFDVCYPKTNELKTVEVGGESSKKTIEITEEVIKFNVGFPICGDFYAMEGVG